LKGVASGFEAGGKKSKIKSIGLAEGGRGTASRGR